MVIDFGDAVARKPEMSDLEAIRAYRNDPRVYSGLGGHFTGMSREDVGRWITHHQTNTKDAVWVVADKATDACLGHCGLYKIDYRIGRAEFGYAFAPEHQGRGLGGRVLAGLIDYGFRHLRLHRIESWNLESNVRTVRIKEQLGFKLEGTLRDYQFRDGKYVNVQAMAILSTDWHGIPEKYRPTP